MDFANKVTSHLNNVKLVNFTLKLKDVSLAQLDALHVPVHLVQNVQREAIGQLEKHVLQNAEMELLLVSNNVMIKTIIQEMDAVQVVLYNILTHALNNHLSVLKIMVLFVETE